MLHYVHLTHYPHIKFAFSLNKPILRTRGGGEGGGDEKNKQNFQHTKSKASTNKLNHEVSDIYAALSCQHAKEYQRNVNRYTGLKLSR